MRLKHLLVLILLLGLGGFLLTTPSPTYAATFTVNDTGDAGDAIPGDGLCETAGNVCTLRAAVQEANAVLGDDTITFNPSLNGQTITLGSEIPISTNITINGPGAGLLTISGNNSTRIFNMTAGTVEIADLTLANGAAPAGIGGGGIYVAGSTLTVTSSTFSGNSADTSGGGIYNDFGSVTVTNSTFSGNSALFGGGIYNLNTLTGTTNNTLFYNSTCSGSFTGSSNVSDPGSTGCPDIDANFDASDLGTLGDYGGPTQTIPLLPDPINGNPAIDGGVGCPATDQRGFARVDTCDIGAYELVKPTVAFNTVASSVTEGATAAPQVDLILATDAGQPVPIAGTFTVDVSYADVTATGGGVDYTADVQASFDCTAGCTTDQINSLSIPAVDDNLLEGDESTLLTLTPSAVQPVLVDAAADDHTLTITDNDSATLQFVSATDSVNEGAGTHVTQVVYQGDDLAAGAQIDFTITRADVTTTDPDDFNGATVVSSGSFVGPISAGATVDVTTPINDDSLAELNEDYILTLAISGTSPAGLVVNLANNPQTVTLIDNDVPGISAIDDDGVLFVEEYQETTDTFTVQLNTLPADTVTVTLTTNGQCTLDIDSLTFTPAEWDVPQTVIVQAVDDAIAEPNPHDCIITLNASSPNDADYNGRQSNLIYNVQDNDVSGQPGQPGIGVFDPAISKIGYLVPGQTGVTGEQLEWIVTVTNTGSAAGTNVVITDTIIPELQINDVEVPAGVTAVIANQDVIVTIPVLNPGQTITFSIFTTTLQGASVSNTVCLVADGFATPRCATGSALAQLPATGESPIWRIPALIAALLLAIAGGWIAIRRRVTA